MDFLNLPERAAKPRSKGITHVLDKGLGLGQIADLVAVAGPYIDIVKLGWGTAYVTANLAQKIELYAATGSRCASAAPCWRWRCARTGWTST